MLIKTYDFGEHFSGFGWRLKCSGLLVLLNCTMGGFVQCIYRCSPYSVGTEDPTCDVTHKRYIMSIMTILMMGPTPSPD